MNIFWLEFRRSPFMFASPALFAIGIYFAVTSSYPSVASWTNITQALLATDSFLAPSIAGVAAWDALRSRRRRLADSEETAVRSVAAIRSRQVLAALLWTVLGALVMLAALICRGLIVGLTGTPEILSLIYSVGVPLLFVLVGHITVAAINHWVAIPVAIAVPLVLYAVNLFATGSSTWLAMNPLYRYTQGDPYMPDAAFYGGQLALVIGYALVLGAIIAALGRARATVAVAIVVIMSIPAIVVGTATMHSRGSNSVLASDALRSFEDAETGLTISIQELYGPVTADLLATWSRISRITSESDLAFSNLSQDFDPSYPIEPAGKWFRLDLQPLSADIAATSVEMALNDISTCQFGASDPPQGDWWLEGQLVIRTWLAGDQSFPPSVMVGDPDMQTALDALHKLDGKEGATWFAAHASNLRACDWSKSDFAVL
jgi:hypothetical protein